MSSDEIENIIINYMKTYDPTFVGLFGSFARGDYSKDSDIDILVRFQETYSLLQIVRIENELSAKIGLKVDIVTEGSLKNERVKKSIHKDLQIIYEV